MEQKWQQAGHSNRVTPITHFGVVYGNLHYMENNSPKLLGV